MLAADQRDPHRPRSAPAGGSIPPRPGSCRSRARPSSATPASPRSTAAAGRSAPRFRTAVEPAAPPGDSVAIRARCSSGGRLNSTCTIRRVKHAAERKSNGAKRARLAQETAQCRDGVRTPVRHDRRRGFTPRRNPLGIIRLRPRRRRRLHLPCRRARASWRASPGSFSRTSSASSSHSILSIDAAVPP